MKHLIACLCLLAFNSALACDQSLPPRQLQAIGQQIYKNECNQQSQCLVHWNRGEAFPSLGIGHFIWYPDGMDAGFVEDRKSVV